MRRLSFLTSRQRLLIRFRNTRDMNILMKSQMIKPRSLSVIGLLPAVSAIKSQFLITEISLNLAAIRNCLKMNPANTASFGMRRQIGYNMTIGCLFMAFFAAVYFKNGRYERQTCFYERKDLYFLRLSFSDKLSGMAEKKSAKRKRPLDLPDEHKRRIWRMKCLCMRFRLRRLFP